MDSKASFASEELFGFFELDDSGTVRYWRPTSRASNSGDQDPLVGENFFDHAHFTNSDDLKRHFRQFVHGHNSAESFKLDCLFENETVKAKVLMTRAFDTDLYPPANLVMLDIRKELI
jgi:hypothetical protein